MTTASRYSLEVRERAVRMVLAHEREYNSQWSAIVLIAEKIDRDTRVQGLRSCILNRLFLVFHCKIRPQPLHRPEIPSSLASARPVGRAKRLKPATTRNYCTGSQPPQRTAAP